MILQYILVYTLQFRGFWRTLGLQSGVKGPRLHQWAYPPPQVCTLQLTHASTSRIQTPSSPTHNPCPSIASTELNWFPWPKPSSCGTCFTPWQCAVAGHILKQQHYPTWWLPLQPLLVQPTRRLQLQHFQALNTVDDTGSAGAEPAVAEASQAEHETEAGYKAAARGRRGGRNSIKSKHHCAWTSVCLAPD